ncbi:MAG: hypothetical protein ABSA67_10770 [Candidatus Brocadiia bacterium]|jgi:hypothetical protein
MDELKQFERWAVRAREERSPEPDVTPAVLARLRHTDAEAPTGPGAWIWAASALAGCAAVLAAVVGYAAWAELAAPWTSWFSDLSNWGAL